MITQTIHLGNYPFLHVTAISLRKHIPDLMHRVVHEHMYHSSSFSVSFYCTHEQNSSHFFSQSLLLIALPMLELRTHYHLSPLQHYNYPNNIYSHMVEYGVLQLPCSQLTHIVLFFCEIQCRMLTLQWQCHS